MGVYSMASDPIVWVSYKCKKCGAAINKSARSGPPLDGMCPQAPKVNGFRGPHQWTVIKVK